MLAPGSVELELEGGTDVRGGPPWDNLVSVILPFMCRLATVDVDLRRRGFYPAGGGRAVLSVVAGGSRAPLHLTERGDVVEVRGVSVAAQALQARNVAERQTAAVEAELRASGLPVHVQSVYADALSPGTSVALWAVCETGAIIGADQLGARQRSAEDVGRSAARLLKARLAQGAPVDEFLADALVPVLGLCGGDLRCELISEHTWANIHVVETFLGVQFDIDEAACRIACTRPYGP
jgi:RNA 3'-terminal phosphate cyclase (ATP)